MVTGKAIHSLCIFQSFTKNKNRALLKLDTHTEICPTVESGLQKRSNISIEGWKEKLRKFEQNKEWDNAIDLMEVVIEKLPEDVDAAICMNYLLMNLLVEERLNAESRDDYAPLAKKYFDISYARFSKNAEYLYFTAITAAMSEWYFGINRQDYEVMLARAKLLDPTNPVYKEDYYYKLHEKDHNNKEAFEYATMVLREDSPVKKLLLSKGACGEYIFGLRKHWSEAVVGIRPCYQH